MYYEVIMRLFEGFKNNPVQGTLIALLIAVFFSVLFILTDEKNPR